MRMKESNSNNNSVIEFESSIWENKIIKRDIVDFIKKFEKLSEEKTASKRKQMKQNYLNKKMQDLSLIAIASVPSKQTNNFEHSLQNYEESSEFKKKTSCKQLLQPNIA